MRLVTAALTAVTMLVATVWYVYLVVRGRIAPVLASWIILATTMTLSYAAYWHAPNHTIAGNIGNLTGVVSTVAILASIIGREWKTGWGRSRFNAFQMQCLAGAGVIIVIWSILRFVIGGGSAAFISNVLTQILMVIGYVALVERLWTTRKERESLFSWTFIFLASSLSFGPALYPATDWLGLLYAFRATVTSGIAVWLISKIRSQTLNPTRASS